MSVSILNYINGKNTPPQSNEWIDVIDPSTGHGYALLARSSVSDVTSAIEAASAALDSWKHMPVAQRSNILMKMANLIDQNCKELAEAESKDNGKPLALAKEVDIPRAAANLRYFANAILQFHTEAYDMDGQALNYTLRQPVGVVTCISPWNLPLYLFTWKIAPALASGCTIVAKPSEVTPMTAFLLGGIATQAGLPPGVLNIVNGYGMEVGPTLCTHPDIKAITFTGSTITGETIAKMAAPSFKKCALEMGGKNPNIIFNDCNFEKAMESTLRSSFSNQGQICLCGSRLYIQSSIYGRFRDALVQHAQNLVVGPPFDAKTKIGAVVSETHMNKILRHIAIAIEEGGTILCGGHRVEMQPPYQNGYYIAPTIIEGLSNHCRTNQEEIFGPVVTITPFDTIDQAIGLANETPYGLSATIWSNNIETLNTCSRKIQAGVIWCNTWMTRDLRTPFGGMKQSGLGKEGGYEALRFFTDVKNVCIGHHTEEM